MTHHMAVGYLGPSGTYSHAAALQSHGNEELVPLKTLEDVVQAVKTGRVQRAVLPVENSTNGEVRRALDALVAEIGDCPELQAVGQVQVQIAHQVYTKASSLSEIKRLYSHPQVWGQVTRWLSEMKSVECIDCDSTSQAIERALSDECGAAIAGAAAGKVYGVTPFIPDVADCSSNTTRFLILARAPAPTDLDNAMVTFCVAKPDLCTALAAFANNGVAITFITSRPQGTNWTYRYIVEFAGGLSSDAVKAALKTLQEITEVTLVGAY